MRLSFVVPTVFISCLTGTAIVSVFGISVYSTLFWYNVSYDLFQVAFGKEFSVLSWMMVVLLSASVVLILLGLAVNQVFLCLLLSFLSQLIAVIIALYLALKTQSKYLEERVIEIERRYTSLPVSEFESSHMCKGVRAHNCLGGCCDGELRNWLSHIYKGESSYFLVFGLLWVVSMTFFIPASVGVVWTDVRRERILN